MPHKLTQDQHPSTLSILMSDTEGAPKEWAGRFLEDLDVGDIFRSRLGRTITEADNIWFTCLTMNTNQMHFNNYYAERSRFGKALVNSTLTLALVTGLSVPDLSENAVANLSWDKIRLVNPVYVGDTLWSESEVLHVRSSKTNPEVGIVNVRTRGINQRGETAIEFLRTIMLPLRSSKTGSRFPTPIDEWTLEKD